MQTSNSILAKLLATENITVQHQSSIKTAMFDLKNRVLMLPVWQGISVDLEHLLLGHETGHAIDTPSADEYKAAYEGIAKRVFGDDATNNLTHTVAGFLNVIEDARIDKRQKRRYPGLRKNYLIGYKELIDRDFFGTKGRDLNAMNFIDRLNIYFKGGNVNFNIDFSPEERVFLKRVENLELFDDVVAITEEIYRFCKDKIENELHMDIELGDSDDNDGDGQDWDSDYDYDTESSSDDDDEDGDGAGADEDDDDNDDMDNSRQTSSGAGAKSSGAFVPNSETDRVWEKKREELAKDSNTEYVYVNMPEYDYAKNVHGYKKVLNDWRNERSRFANYGRNITCDVFNDARREMMEWRQKEKETISFLVKEFEQRKSAEMYARISIAKTGVVDTNKLHSYKFNDDIFRRMTVIPEGKNHGFVMFLDWSGSMCSTLKHTLKQLFTLALFCKQIQVPFEVYAFKDSDQSASSPWTHTEVNSMNFGHLTLRQFLSSKMTLAELNEAMTYLWAVGHNYRLYSDDLSGTPLNEALVVAPKIVNDFRSKNKLEIVNVIVLTDGESNGSMGLVNTKTTSSHFDMISGRRTQSFHYNDPKTGKTYDIYPNCGYGSSNNNTNTYLQILKERTNCNLIGFFLFSDSFRSFTYRFNLQDNYDYMQKVTKFWKENKYFPVKSVGYDDYFVIDVGALKNTENTLEIDTSKNTRQMAKAFSKFATKKQVNRVLLRNFIDYVTGRTKRVV